LLIGFSGRFVEEKGILDLVAAVDILRERNASAAVELTMLGNGPLRDALDQLSRDRPWLRLLPPRPHREVAFFMQMLDVFVLPSTSRNTGAVVWQEQFGHVLVEAMACGVACLGSDSGEIPRVIVDPTGIFPAGNRASLAGKIEVFIADSAERDRLARRQREHTLQHYTNRSLATEWASFLRERLADSRCGASASQRENF
jgi:glycosyltransferase involved in cell wall biosynthesis